MWQLDTRDTPTPLADIAHRTTHGNLPPVRTSVFGRDNEVSDLVGRIQNERLVSLVGVGGVGKTTLAQATARMAADAFPAGTWFVDLASVDEPDGVPAAVAASLEISQRPAMTIVESVCDALDTERRLVIIDNAEHVIDAVAELADIVLNSVLDPHLLVTSRESLAVEGEIIHRVLPLAIENAAGDAPAVALFKERAQRVAPDLDPSSFDTREVADICCRLDGLPLAIELAASQCETMTPTEILEAMLDHSITLQSASRSLVQRHRSLDNMIEWSYARLEEVDRIVFDRLAVFSAGCTAEAARFVCSDETVGEDQVMASLRVLTRKSMIILDRAVGTTRFDMLETLRSFSESRMSERSGRIEVERHHAEWFATLSAAARDGMSGPDEARHLKLLMADIGNIQQASRWACAHEAFELMADLGASLPYIVGSKMRPGMLGWIHEALAVLPPDHPARLDFAFATAYHALFTGDLHGSTNIFASATAQVADRAKAEVLTSNFKLISALFLGEMDLVIRDSGQALADAHDTGLTRVAGAFGTDLALALLYTGDTDEARRIAGNVSADADRSGNPTLIAWARYVSGEIEADADPAGAMEMLEESVEYSITVDNEFVAGIALIALASTAGRHGNTAVAFDAMDRCIHLFWGAGNRPQLWTAVRNLVEILHNVGADREALILHTAADADSQHAPKVFGPIGDRYRDIVEEVTESLGQDAAADAIEQGQSLGYNDAVEFALDVIARIA
jgi:predicted ATPase